MNTNKNLKKTMSQTDKIEWDKLYEYVRTDILGYTKDQSLSKHMVLRLKGMLNGKYYANNKTSDKGNYSYNIVLLTFKYCKSDIVKAMQRKTFASEINKFNYICAIVESHLNDVYIKIHSAKKTEDVIERTDFSHLTHKGADYVTKGEKLTGGLKDRLEELW